MQTCHPIPRRSRPGRSAVCQPGRRSVAGRRPGGRRQRSALAGHRQGLEAKLRIDGVLQGLALVPRALAANVIARLEGPGRVAHLSHRHAPGGPHPPGRRRRRNAAEHLPHAPRRKRRRAALRPRRAVRAACRPGPARRRPARARGTAGRDGRGHSRLRTGRQRKDDDRLRLPPRTRRAGRRARSLVSLEDPIEVAVPGVAQSQVNAAAGLDLATGLRFLMRQDPEVIMVGEIRDRATAEAAMQASLTGHLLLSTFHAGSAVETLGRLLDMGIEPYVVRSGLLAILCQRLLRRLCPCAREIDDPQDYLGLPVLAGPAAGRLPGLRRERLSRADPAGGNAGPEVGRGGRVGPGRPGPGRHQRVGTVGGAGRHGHALATGDSGRGKRRNQPRRGPPRPGPGGGHVIVC